MSWSADFSIAAEQSAWFARLAGDYNPVHLDPVAARRLPFGGTVVHGIHLLLETLERSTASWSDKDREPCSLAVTFSSPVRTAQSVAVTVAADASGQRLRLAGRVEGRTAFSGAVELATVRSPECAALPDREFPEETPTVDSFPPRLIAGVTPLALSRDLLSHLFPALATHHPGWIADLLATTRIVGMRCPGMDSVYAVCRLHRRTPPASRADTMRYEVVSADERFRMIRLQVTGGAWEGDLEAFFRARPVEQPQLSEVTAQVPAGSFSGQRALVIGGSRGLGELSAKLIAAGGGDVVITYSQGRSDAERICAEAQTGGFKVSAQHLDLSGVASAADLPAWLAASDATHVYYFASPPITRSAPGAFSRALYEQFEDVYVRAFAAVAHRFLAARAAHLRPKVLYPSSVFLDTAPPGFAEYCQAKTAGEALCAALSRQYSSVIRCPRLPRVRTDQTSSVRDTEVQDALPVLLPLLFDLR
jgi:NADP-dependent 3-hydroxy acid dehydrogenase YdfG